MILRRLAALFALSLLAAVSAPAQAVVEGRVTLPKARPGPVMNKRYAIVTKGGVLSPYPPVAVVYLEGPFPQLPPGSRPAPLPPKMMQKDLEFVPNLLPIQVGTRVEFPNLDDTYHNIFSYSAAKRFDLGRYRSDERPIPAEVFDVAGLVTVRCDIHEHMRALILVLDTPYFVLSDTEGRYRLTDLPPGRHVLKAWLDSKTTLEKPVNLRAGAVLPVSFPVISASQAKSSPFSGFRLKLLVAMMLVVSAVAAVALVFAQRSAAANAQRQFEREFQDRVSSLHAVEDVRNAVLAERCRELALRPRIHAALEDNALDLLYPSARNELADIMDERGSPAEPAEYPLHALFYRFLDGSGRVISPPDPRGVGSLTLTEESQLTLPRIPDRPQVGYLWRQSGSAGPIDELIAMPIVSTETGDVIAAIVLGFRPADLDDRPAEGIVSGLCVDGRLSLPGLAPAAQAAIAVQVGRASARSAEGSFAVSPLGAPYRLFYKSLNPGSLYPPACEVILYPLSGLLAAQRLLLWKYALAAALLLFGALAASNFLSIRLSRPVEKLAVDSEENLTQRKRAEDALASTSLELQRSARFSADASHQLKTPVTVLRAGLEELMAAETLSPAGREEISNLIHQTFRLTSIVEDLLLLSRLDAGRLQLAIGRVDLRALIEAGLDDLGTLPEETELKIETDLPPSLTVSGEKRYTSLILQNLLENARKYNHPGGCIRISAREEGDWVVLTVGNTGRGIPPTARDHIFERFHRGGVGEDLPGHGLGLNLARELARIHGGELQLSRSDETWTEFELRLRRAGEAP